MRELRFLFTPPSQYSLSLSLSLLSLPTTIPHIPIPISSSSLKDAKNFRSSKLQRSRECYSSLEVLVEEFVHLSLVPVVLAGVVLLAALAWHNLVVLQLGLQLALPILFCGADRRHHHRLSLFFLCGCFFLCRGEGAECFFLSLSLAY